MSTHVTPPRHARWRLLPLGRARLIWYPRTTLVMALLLVVLTVLVPLALTTGSTPLGIEEVLRGLAGGSSAPVVRDLRLPRAVCGLLVGAGLAVAGSVMQSLTRNTLGSPDVLGVTTGAALGASVAIIVLGLGPLGTALGALIGTVLVSAITYLLTWNAHRSPGQRLVLVGIGVAAFCRGLVSLVLTHSNPDIAISAQIWMTGTLNARTWADALAPAAVVAVLLPVLLAAARHLNALESGDEVAQQMGVNLPRTRLVAAVCSVALTAGAVCSVGPVSLVALAAPHLARRLTGTAIVPVLPAAACGAVLLLGADLTAQRLPESFRVPVGIATGVLGGLYLVLVLMRRPR